ncbi:unnamed protein product [Ilex paraguariensis]|uniref:Uncharacterized protein n=1 Tax=Ilex paraguariensis TaxID=185542 RepID=A0ABC8TWX8_9AQUA
MEDDLDLDHWNLCAEAEAFFEILELLNANGSKIGVVAKKIDNMQNIVFSSIRFSDRSKRIYRVIKDYKNYKDNFEAGLKIQQTLDEVYDSLTNRFRRLMRLRSIHCDVKMIKVIRFMSQLFGYIGPITILGFPKNQRAIMAAEARRLKLKKQIVDEVPSVQFVDRLAILRRSFPRHTHPPPSDRYLHLLLEGKVLANLSYT